MEIRGNIILEKGDKNKIKNINKNNKIINKFKSVNNSMYKT